VLIARISVLIDVSNHTPGACVFDVVVKDEGVRGVVGFDLGR
jgi:hypothetical protein